MTEELKNLRARLVAAGVMAIAFTSIFSGPAMAYTGTADDLTQMQQLLAAYSNALDGEDPDGYAGVFTANGSWHSPTRCYTGKEQIRKLGADANVRFRGPMGNPPGQYPVSHMTVLGHVIFDDANHAHAHETNILVGSQGFVQALKGGADIFYTGYYNDTFERQPNGRWLISDRDENSGADPVTGIHDEKYHPVRPCPPTPKN